MARITIGGLLVLAVALVSILAWPNRDDPVGSPYSSATRPEALTPDGLGDSTTTGAEVSAGPTRIVEVDAEPPQEFVVADFEDEVLHDKAWLQAQPTGTIGFFVQPKPDSGIDSLSLAPGEGVDGSTALLVEANRLPDRQHNLPGFWLYEGITNSNGGIDRIKTEAAYMLPVGQPANRLQLSVRFQAGFKDQAAASQPPAWPNHQNLTVGTYNFNPAEIDGVRGVFESSERWHFYHQIFLRHDQAGTAWITVVLNEQPQHWRNSKGSLPNNPTGAAGGYYETMTRIYVDLFEYFSDPEISYPIKMWVDDVKFVQVSEAPSVAIEFTGKTIGQEVQVSKGVEVGYPFTFTNLTGQQVCGLFTIHARTSFDASIVGKDTSDQYCLDPAASEEMVLEVEPGSASPRGERSYMGVSFVENHEFESAASTGRISHSDTNVEKRNNSNEGPHDARVVSGFLVGVVR